MTTLSREKEVESYLINRCKQEGFYCLKFVSPTTNGVPDRIIIMPSYTFFVEVKRPKGVTRALQDAVIRRMRNAGAIVFRCDTKKKVEEILQNMKNNKLPSYLSERKEGRMQQETVILTPKKKEEIVKKFVSFLSAHDYFHHVRIFYDEYLLDSEREKPVSLKPILLREQKYQSLYDVTEYGNEKTITVLFNDSPLYKAYNEQEEFQLELKRFFRQYDLEMVSGYSWSFSLYPITNS